MSFRLKLFVAIMASVLAVATLTLYLADRNATEEVNRNADHQFRDAFEAMREPRRVRQQIMAERCRGLAKSVRIRAALEESSADDLYANAEVELRGVLASEPASSHAGRSLQARFFRFLDANGAVLSPPPTARAGSTGASEAKLKRSGPASDRQDIGYLLLPSESGGPAEICELISTPIVATDTNEVIGAIVLGFSPLGLNKPLQAEGLKAGLWVEGRLLLPMLASEARTELAAHLPQIVQNEAPEHGLPVRVFGEMHLLRWQQLNPNSSFPPAYEICLFPLASSLARQARFRWQILGAAAVLILGGLLASHYTAGRLSAPIQKLEEDSAVHRAERDRAESALEKTNQELIARNAELQKALAEIKATQAQIIQQERLSALGQMASGIAHDFNNTLVPILGYSQLLQLNPKLLADEPRTREYLALIETAAGDAASVVSRLQQFYRPREGNESFGAVDLNRVAEQAVRLTQPRWKSQAQGQGSTIAVQTDLDLQLPPVAGNESALREALTNLIFNAVDAMPQGGTITVRTRRTGESAQLEVQDTGSGMTEAVRLRCLEPFFSTKGQRGTGLGLAMVFGIAQRHGGSLNVESELGRGTTFTLNIPLHVPASKPDPAAVTQERERSLQVLVIDDEPMVRDLVAQALELDGHKTQTASKGDEGLRRFLEGVFDLVVTDMAMPGMNGDQVAKLLKQSSPHTPVILLTGFGEFLEKKDLPFVDVVLPKPVDLHGLRKAVASAVSLA